MNEEDTNIGETEVHEHGCLDSTPVWNLEEIAKPIITTFNQTRTALTEGVVIEASVGIRLAEGYKDIVEVLELQDGQWQVILAHQFETEKNYVLKREERAWGIPNEIIFSSRIARGRNNLRFYVGDDDQEVIPTWRLGITFPPPQITQ